MIRVKFILISAFIIGIVGLGLWEVYFYYSKHEAKAYYESIKNNPRVYAYDTSRGVLRPILYIKDINKKSALIHYYDSMIAWNIAVSEGKIKPKIGISPITHDTFMAEPVAISFTPRYFTCITPLILVSYASDDSLIAEVVDFNTECWGYIRGYVYTKTLHTEPASDKIIEAYNKYWTEKEQSEENQRKQRISINHSPYGVQCD